MRLVLDTNTVVSALLWEGVPKRLLTMVQDKGVSLFTSEPLIAELADVLSRRKFERQLVAGLKSTACGTLCPSNYIGATCFRASAGVRSR